VRRRGQRSRTTLIALAQALELFLQFPPPRTEFHQYHVTDPKNAVSRRLGQTSQRAPGRGIAPENCRKQFSACASAISGCTTSLASAAHDLKTPLSIISGYVGVLQGEKLGALNDRQREVLGDMASSCKRLQNFIQDFLTYSVLETGEMQLRFEMGDLNESLAGFAVCGLRGFRKKAWPCIFWPTKNHALPIRRPQSAASNLESVGQCVQVHADGRHGLAAR